MLCIVRSCHLSDFPINSFRVLIPTLGEEQSGKRKLRAGEDAPVLAVSALSDLLACITNLLIVGAGGPSFAYKACGFTEELLKTGK